MSNIMAFPCPATFDPQGNIIAYHEPGMNLRDYFAAAALPGLVALYAGNPMLIATYAYIQADAMLMRRGKP